MYGSKEAWEHEIVGAWGRMLIRESAGHDSMEVC